MREDAALINRVSVKHAYQQVAETIIARITVGQSIQLASSALLSGSAPRAR